MSTLQQAADGVVVPEQQDVTRLYRIKHSNKYQFKGLIYKNLALQKKQTKSNVCQIMTPLLMLGLVVLFQFLIDLAMGDPAKGGELMDYTNSSFIQFNSPNITGMMKSWDWYMYASNGNNVGYLNETGGADGLLGGIMQHEFYFLPENTTSEMSPHYNEFASEKEMSEAIYDLLVAAQGAPPANFRKLAMPTGQCPRGTRRCLKPEDFNLITPARYSVPNGGVVFKTVQSDKLEMVIQAPTPPTSADMSGSYYADYAYFPDSFYGDDGITRAIIMLNDIVSSWLYNLGGLTRTAFAMMGLPYVSLDAENFDVGTMSATFLYPFAISFVLPLFVYQVVLEKQSRLRMLMKCSGVDTMKYWAANFMYDFLLYTCVILMFVAGGFAISQNFFTKTAAVVWIVLFVLWGLVQITMAFFLASLFAKTRSANIFSYLLVIISVSFSMLLTAWFYPAEPIPSQFYIHPHFAAYRAIFLICMAITDTLKKPLTFDDMVPGTELFQIYTMLFVMFIVYGLLAYYMEQVFPGEYGIPKHPLFFLGMKRKTGTGSRVTVMGLDNDVESNLVDVDVADQQVKVDAGQKGAVILNRTTKIYPIKNAPPTVAVNDFSLLIKEGEFFGFIGPNGAGKSTLMNIVAGLSPMTSGVGSVCGHDISTESDAISKKLGYCPQFECVWGELTVREHLLFFARLRGVSPDLENDVVVNATKDMSLMDAIDRRANQLSGGMRRRLAVAMALVGGPDIILLDEPSTGLDPVSRTQMWAVLKRISMLTKASFLLTTHSMEEAEYLSNRVAIISNGALKAVGTTQHLKKRFGNGYRMTIITDRKRMPEVKDFVSANWPTATLTTEFNGLAIYKIPLDACILSKVVMTMESRKHLFDDYGISQSSLNEVWNTVLSESE